jgi:type IV fimbrial biogenesis protein FimT
MTPRCSPRLSRGVTLFELLIVIGLVLVLTSIAIPSYKYVTSSNRVSAEINGLLGDLQFARSEAIKEGLPVVVCAAASTTQCATGTNWAGGWLVFPDPNNNQTVDAGETILRVQTAFTGTDTFSANNSISWVSFNREGFASASGTGLSTTSMLTLHTTPVNNAATRCLMVGQVGLMSVQTYNGSGPCT